MLKVLLVHRVLLELREPQVLRVLQDQLVLKVLQVLQDLMHQYQTMLIIE